MNIRLKTLGMLVDELMTVSQKLFKAQDNLMNENFDEEKRLEFAIQAQRLNKTRNALIRAIDESVGQADNSPTEKTY